VAAKHSMDLNRTEVIANIHTWCPHTIREASKITKYVYNFSQEDIHIKQNLALPVFPEPLIQPPLPVNSCQIVLHVHVTGRRKSHLLQTV
jgi:hypothetical protein